MKKVLLAALLLSLSQLASAHQVLGVYCDQVNYSDLRLSSAAQNRDTLGCNVRVGIGGSSDPNDTATHIKLLLRATDADGLTKTAWQYYEIDSDFDIWTYPMDLNDIPYYFGVTSCQAAQTFILEGEGRVGKIVAGQFTTIGTPWNSSVVGTVQKAGPGICRESGRRGGGWYGFPTPGF